MGICHLSFPEQKLLKFILFMLLHEKVQVDLKAAPVGIVLDGLTLAKLLRKYFCFLCHRSIANCPHSYLILLT
jgi:hypothetical protein